MKNNIFKENIVRNKQKVRSIYLKKILIFKRNSLYALLCEEIQDLNHLIDKNIN
jgi:hypothetical protein